MNVLNRVIKPRIIVANAIAVRNVLPSDFFTMKAAMGADVATPMESIAVRSQLTPVFEIRNVTKPTKLMKSSEKL